MADLDYLINFNSDTTGIDKSKFAISKLGAAMAALGIGFGAAELASIADEYSNIASRVNIAVGETGNFEGAMEGVKNVSLATNSNLTATTMLFTKINDAGKELGLTQKQSLDLTETINKAMQLGGGAAASNEAAIVQLTQALASGVLRGDEFNSIMEQAPGISKALAASLGVTTGELRAMAGEGKLSAQTVISALQDQSATIATEYSKLPITVDKALQNIRTQWMVLIGEFNQDSGATSKVVEWLGVLEDNMALLDTVLADVGEGMQWVGDQLDGIDTGTIVAMKQAFESAYDALKSMAVAAGDVLGTIGSGLELTLGMLFSFESGLTDAESKTAGFTKAIQFLNVALGFISDGFGAVGIASKLITGAFYDMAAAWYQLKSNFVTGSWKDEAIANMQAMGVKAQQMYSEASDAALEFKSKGLEAINDLSKTEAQLNADTLADLKSTFEDKAQAYDDYVLSEKDYSAQRIALEQQVNEARKNGSTASIAILLKQLDEVTEKEIESSKVKEGLEQSKLDAVQKFAQQAADANGGVLDSTTLLQLATKNYMASVDDAGKVSVDAWSKVRRSSDESNLSLKDFALTAAKGLGIDVAEALNQVSSGFERNSESVRRVADGYSELKREGLNAGDLLSASLEKLLAGAKSQAEIDNVRQMYVQFGQDGKLSTNQVGNGIDAINQKLAKSPQLLDETTRAFKELGIISQAEADKQAKDAIANYEIVKQSGEASADQLKKALDSVYSKIKDSGDAGLQSWYKNQEAALGYNSSLKEVEQSTVRTTTAIKDNASARQEQSIATWNAAMATEKATQNESASLAYMQQVTGAIKGKIGELQKMGATTEQVNATWAKFMDSLGHFEGKKWLGIADFTRDMQRMDDVVKAQVTSFENAKSKAEQMTQALSGSAVTSRDLTDAQHALRKATDASVQGIIRMDDQTLDKLKSAIDGARQRMKGLADDAKNTADSLEAALAKMQGNEDKARNIEQAKKLSDIELKLAEAKARNNREEEAQLKRALDLQKQINKEEDKKARADSKTSASPQPSNNNLPSSNQASNNNNAPNKKITVELKSNAGTVDALIPEAQEDLFNKFVQQLQDSKALSGR